MELYAPPPGFVPTYTWATKPTTLATGQPVFLSNVGPKGSHWWYDGTRWKVVGGMLLLASLDTTVAGLTNSEVVTFSYQAPAALFQLKDRLRISYVLTKSGTTDTGTGRIRMGTAGTTSDTLLNSQSNTQLAAASRAVSILDDYRFETSTSIQHLGNSNASDAKSGYSNFSASAAVAAVTISDFSNSLFITLNAFSSSTNDTVGIQDVQVELHTTPN